MAPRLVGLVVFLLAVSFAPEAEAFALRAPTLEPAPAADVDLLPGTLSLTTALDTGGGGGGGGFVTAIWTGGLVTTGSGLVLLALSGLFGLVLYATIPAGGFTGFLLIFPFFGAIAGGAVLLVGLGVLALAVLVATVEAAVAAFAVRELPLPFVAVADVRDHDRALHTLPLLRF